MVGGLGVFWVLGAAVLIIMLIPVRLCLAVNNDHGMYIDGRVCYGAGLFCCRYYRHAGRGTTTFKALGLPLYSSSFPKDREAGSGEEMPGIISVYRTKRKFLKYITGIARDTIKTAVGKRAVLRLKLGFEDPAYTGMAAGLMACISSYFRNALQYTPDFSGQNFEVDLYLKGVIIPLVLVFIGVKHGALYIGDRLLERINVKGGRRYGFNG
ncbi:MAG TPA: hypothetical protein VFF83_01155 [Clostridia bacterium]|nr:hypothetical protein [Clostridia bacterium]